MSNLGALSYASGASIHNVFPDASMPETATGFGESYTWKYEDMTVTNSYGPADWDMADATYVCNSGTMQSPIDIVTANVAAPTTDPGAIVGNLFGQDLDGYLANTGRALRYMVFGYARPTISGGALGTKIYALSHIDFHFGSVSTQGSEHTVDGTKYAMEMEMIFYDGSFASNADAMASTDADALVALSHFFTVSKIKYHICIAYNIQYLISTHVLINTLFRLTLLTTLLWPTSSLRLPTLSTTQEERRDLPTEEDNHLELLWPTTLLWPPTTWWLMSSSILRLSLVPLRLTTTTTMM